MICIDDFSSSWSTLLIVKALRDFLGGYCADLSTSMKFGIHVDKNIINSFLRAPKQATIFAKSNMAAS